MLGQQRNTSIITLFGGAPAGMIYQAPPHFDLDATKADQTSTSPASSRCARRSIEGRRIGKSSGAEYQFKQAQEPAQRAAAAGRSE